MSHKTKTRNWTEDETILLCEILADPMNNYLATLETKALKKDERSVHRRTGGF